MISLNLMILGLRCNICPDNLSLYQLRPYILKYNETQATKLILKNADINCFEVMVLYLRFLSWDEKSFL